MTPKLAEKQLKQASLAAALDREELPPVPREDEHLGVLIGALEERRNGCFEWSEWLRGGAAGYGQSASRSLDSPAP